MPNQASPQQIDDYLELFENDVDEAMSAIKVRATQTPKRHTASRPPSDKPTIISVQELTKTYRIGKRQVIALRGVSFNIGEGEFVALTGPSGSGKSTLLQIIGCLDKPTSGQVTVDTRDTNTLGDNALSELRKSTIGFIFQSFYLQPFLRLRDNLAVPAMFTNAKKKDTDDKVSSLLEQVGLSDRANHFPKELSGGQIQRAAIARALMNNPKIILADEPTGNLDSANSQSIIDLFKKIRDELGTTVIVVTHNSEIASQADRN
jgi:ABC-type lipoprotein export system ATPase subunit